MPRRLHANRHSSFCFPQQPSSDIVVKNEDAGRFAPDLTGPPAVSPPDRKRSRHGERGQNVRFTTGRTVTEQRIAELLILGENMERERRRENQRRYRQRQEDRTAKLESENQRLRGEIEKLKRYNRNASTKDLMCAAIDYFSLFSQGLEQSHSTSAKESVQATMASDVSCNAGCGPEAAVQCSGFSHWFDDVQVEINSFHMTAGKWLVARTTTSVTITERTLHKVFPHLCSSDAAPSLVYKQRIVMRGSTRFGWDRIYGQMTSVMSQSNMLTPVLRLVGSLEDVSRVFEKALVTPDFQWRSSP
ncbi:unnamed protein product [Phytophthora lilii]|uniref:Unnamed protein product n=1 Tax=Phytophthora lilii TaxID=2077276 RepID=A0A9W6TFA7_9STRA|nr:unnamed protein product [Phytophthora lilii]